MMIQLRDIERIFTVGNQQVHALDHVNLKVSGGDYLSIMGPSGSGKSTLLHILGLLDHPSAGDYLLQNRNTTALSDDELASTRRNEIGFVFQFFHLIPRLNARDNIELPLVLAGLPPAERKPRVDAILEATGLTDRAHHRPEQLSGGQRQRVAIARATIMQPALLLADEPTGNLDRASGNEVIDVLEQLNTRGITLIVVTHDRELGRRARRRIRMIDGKIVNDEQD